MSIVHYSTSPDEIPCVERGVASEGHFLVIQAKVIGQMFQSC